MNRKLFVGSRTVRLEVRLKIVIWRSIMLNNSSYFSTRWQLVMSTAVHHSGISHFIRRCCASMHCAERPNGLPYLTLSHLCRQLLIQNILPPNGSTTVTDQLPSTFWCHYSSLIPSQKATVVKERKTIKFVKDKVRVTIGFEILWGFQNIYCMFQKNLFKLRVRASRSRFVGWSVCLSVTGKFWQFLTLRFLE